MFEAEITRGAARLDVYSPGWVYRISEDNLDMASSRTCVLGQLFGTLCPYNLFVPGEDWCDFGFNAKREKVYEHGQVFTILTEEWKGYIKSRLIP